MARLTVRLPDSLHEAIARRAVAEGVSMNQFIVYALTQTASLDLIREQSAQFEALRSRIPAEEAESALEELLQSRESA